MASGAVTSAYSVEARTWFFFSWIAPQAFLRPCQVHARRTFWVPTIENVIRYRYSSPFKTASLFRPLSLCSANHHTRSCRRLSFMTDQVKTTTTQCIEASPTGWVCTVRYPIARFITCMQRVIFGATVGGDIDGERCRLLSPLSVRVLFFLNRPKLAILLPFLRICHVRASRPSASFRPTSPMHKGVILLNVEVRGVQSVIVIQ